MGFLDKGTGINYNVGTQAEEGARCVPLEGKKFMLDKSLPLIGVMMEKRDTKNYPRYALPAGYRFSFYQDGYEEDWARIQFALGQTASYEDALALFWREFGPIREQLYRRSLFVIDPAGRVAAIASLWPGEDYGETRQRLHWVAVDPAHQGRGIAKALLTRVMELYGELGYYGFIYLVSQTWSYKALGIYREFGFVPYMGPCPAGWDSNGYEERTRRAWAMIEEKLADYRRRQGA